MRWIDRMERRLRPFAIPYLTNVLVAFQAILYLGLMLGDQQAVVQQFALIPEQVFQGEVWRVLSYVIIPPAGYQPIFVFFYFYLFYLMGNALETQWGNVAFNLFLGIGLAATAGVGLAAAAIAPEQFRPQDAIGNEFVYGSIFLAFAHMFPNFQLLLFFILPVKIRWLALIQWAGYAIAMFSGGLAAVVMIGPAVLNFFVFFGPDLVRRVLAGKRRMEQKAAKIAESSRPKHVCAICGISNLTHPDEQFRYCSKCHGTPAYCEAHLRTHEHIEPPM